MRSQVLRARATYIIAIDEASHIAYLCPNNMTLISKKLPCIGSTKPINRKTAPKHLDQDTTYGGYKWITSIARTYGNYQMIDIMA